MSRGCRGYLLALTRGVRCRGPSVHGIPSIGPTADATVTLNPQPRAEINNLGRLFLTVHNCARSIPKIGGERVFKLGPRYSHRRQRSYSDRPHDRCDAFLRLRLRLDLCRIFELYGHADSDFIRPAQPARRSPAMSTTAELRRAIYFENRPRGQEEPASRPRSACFSMH